MADAAAARREARKKRILENSHNRLQLIAGKSDNECPKESTTHFPISDGSSEVRPPSVTPDNFSSCFVPPSFNNGVIVAEPEPRGYGAIVEPESQALLAELHNLVAAAGDGEFANNLAALGTPTPTPEVAQPKSLWEKLIAYKYDIVILSLLTQLLYSLSLLTFDSSYFFLPLFIYIVTKLICVPMESKSNIANVFLLLNGMSATRANNIMYATQWISVISQDVCIYLFVTICTQSLLTFLNNFVT